MTFSGHTILITGGTSGIGLGFAKKFAELGNKVIIAARNEDRLNQILSENPTFQDLSVMLLTKILCPNWSISSMKISLSLTFS